MAHQRTQIRLWLQLWPKTSACSGESWWLHTCGLKSATCFFSFFLTCLIGQSSSCTSQVPKIPESWQQQPAGGSHCEFNTGSVCFQKLKLWCSFQHFLIIKFLGALFSSSFCFPTNVVGGLHNKFYLYSSVSSSWRKKKPVISVMEVKLSYTFVCLSAGLGQNYWPVCQCPNQDRYKNYFLLL